VTHRILLDVSSLMYRSYFAMKNVDLRSPGGRTVAALYGYLDMVTRLTISRRPDQLVHAYDHEWRPMARTEVYPGYKATRQVDPEGLPEQFTMLRQVLTFTEMFQAQTPDWEAEDAIAGIVEQAEPGDKIEIVSGDRDLIQLVRDPDVVVLYTLRGVSELLEFDEATVLDKYGIPASRYAEFAILRGDPSDELPGVRGVGEKTAKALIQAYGSLDELLEDAASETPKAGPLRGKPALRARLRESVDYVRAMQEIVPVNGTAPLDLWQGERDDASLEELAEELGVKGPAGRLRAALDSLST
jgi:5'-3' exonuclease